MIKIVIADDHAIVREGLKRIILAAGDMEVAGEAANGSEVMQRVRDLAFDVLVLDLSMPGRSGMEVIRLVHADTTASSCLSCVGTHSGTGRSSV